MPTAPTLFAILMTLERPVEELEAHLPEHLAYIEGLERDGTLLAAGPFLTGDGGNSGDGLVVVRAADAGAAEAIAARDPLARLSIRSHVVRRWELNEGHLTVTVDLSHQQGTLG